MLEFYSASARVVNTKRAVIECLEIALGENEVYNDIDLLIFHASIGHNFEQIRSTAKSLAPNAKVYGASCCGVVGREGVSESMKDIAVMAIKGKEFVVSSTKTITGAIAYDQTLKMAKDLKAQDPNINMIYTLATGIDIANNETIRAIEDVFGSNITIFGATSSDNMRGAVNYQILDDEVAESGAFLIGFSDQTLKIETQATHGFEAIGEPLTVTKSTGNIIHEFNGKPAWKEFTNILGINYDNDLCVDSIPIGALAERLSDEATEIYGNRHILRAVTKHSGDDIYYANTIKEGTELFFTTRNEDLIFSEMDKMTEELEERIKGNVVAVFHADCLARGKLLFGKVIKDELVSKMQTPFSKNGECPPWLGMYGFGEFAKLGAKNEFHNYTTALYVLYR